MEGAIPANQPFTWHMLRCEGIAADVAISHVSQVIVRSLFAEVRSVSTKEDMPSASRLDLPNEHQHCITSGHNHYPSLALPSATPLIGVLLLDY